MKERTKHWIQLLGIATFAGTVVFIGLRVQEAREKALNQVRPQKPVVPRLLAEEEALPGKIVDAVENGKVLESYTCGVQDAAVAWISNRDEDGQPRELIGRSFELIPSAVDDKGDTYPASFQRQGDLWLVRVLRGYAKKPTCIKLHFPKMDSLGRVTYPNDIKLTKFADPIRAVTPPDQEPAEPQSQSIVAYIDAGSPRGFRVRPIPAAEEEARKKNQFYNIKVLASSYQPESQEIYPASTVVNRDRDAVKVQVERYVRVPTEYELVYKNASIAEVNGIPTLRLPTDEDIGEIQGIKATVRRRLSVPKANHKGPIAGDLLIMLDRKISDLTVNQMPSASIVDVSPGVDEMGLDLLRVRLVNYAFGRDFVAKHSTHTPAIALIPELKVRIQVQTPKLLSTQVCVLPIHKEKIDFPAPRPESNVNKVISNNSLFPSIVLFVSKYGFFPGIGPRRGRPGRLMDFMRH